MQQTRTVRRRSALLLLIVAALLLGANSAKASPPVYFAGTGHWYQYVIVPESTCWSVCKDSAAVMGGHLATIGDAAENAFVLSLATLQTDALIGGWRPTPTSPWQWITGEPWTFENWDNGQPGGSPEQYLRLTLPPGFGRTPGKWFDFYNCDDYLDGGPISFVVEYEATIPTLSEWGTIIFGTLLFASVAFYIWRRRRVVTA